MDKFGKVLKIKSIRFIIFKLLFLIPNLFYAQTLTTVYPKNNFLTGDSTISFKWNTKSVFNNYQLEVSTTPNFNSFTYISNKTNTNNNIYSFNIFGDYYWRIKAFTPSNDSSLSNTCILSLFSPYDIGGMQIWLNADKNLTTLNNKVTQWGDLSSFNKQVLQSDTSKSPSLIVNTLNGHSAVKFDGINDALLFQDTTINNMIFILSSWDGANTTFPSYCSLISCGNPVAGDQILVSRNGTTDFYNGSYYGDSLIINGNYSINYSPLNQYKLVSGYKSIAKTYAGTQKLRIGHDNYYDPWKGSIPELILYKKAGFDNVAMAKLNSYFYNKYAPPINLGFDINISNSVCDTTIIPLNPNNNQYTYQWSTGATTPTISVNKGGKYWVNATNIFGKISSDTIIVNLPNYNPPTQNFICTNGQLKWNTQLPNSNFTFLWQDNLSTDSVFTITQSGNYYVKINDIFGCSITSDTIKIVEDNFSANVSLGPDTSLCSGNSITLTSGVVPSLTYTWSTGSQNDSLLITNTGQYSVIVTNTNNCVAKDTINVTVLGLAPTANFTFNAGCLNTAVSFTNLSIPASGNTITNSEWNFGDPLSANNTSTVSNSFHTFSDTGTYSIKLKVITNVGCEQTIIKTIHIAPTPTVNFSNGISCQNDSTAFSSSIISTPGYSVTSLSWNFGDPSSGSANTSNLLSPKHLFSNPTTYSVQLVATNNVGCQNSIIKPVIVKAQVTASFTNSPPCSNTAVIFQDNSVAPLGSTRLWSFGTNTIGGLTASKTYTSSGVYSVTLTVTGTNFCTSKITKQIIVFLPPVANFTVPIFCSKDTITATNQSISQSGIISSYNWKLNNTVFSSVSNPTITASAGTYSVKLTVVNSFNCRDSITKQVTVLPLPLVDFTTNPSAYYFLNSPVNFIPSITNATYYQWNITGIPTSTIQSPTVSFNTEGSYTVSLNLKDQQGCKNSKTKTISVSKRYLDLAVLNVNTIKDNDGFITVEADIANNGSVPVTTFDIHYKISDAGNIKETWNGTLNPNAFYVYTFIAKSATQKNTANNITCVEIEKANGVVDENISNNNLCNTLNSDEISVSNPIPNPTDGDITLPIILNKDIDFAISIYNSTGQLVYEETTKKGTAGLNFVTLSTSSYARGCYIIKTIIDDKIFIKKFIKIMSK